MEGKGKPEQAKALFIQAWNESVSDFERLTAAHYVARHQPSVADKLKWDESALTLALKINDDRVKSLFPSLFLNVGKCFEDLNDLENALKNYRLGLSFTDQSPENGYESMIRTGILNGIARVEQILDNEKRI